jgi:hypothetical protein
VTSTDGRPSLEEAAPDGLMPAGQAPAALDPAALAGVGGERVGAVASPTADPRFTDDTSELPADACWALQELIVAPHVTEQSRRHWSALLRHEDKLRSRLSELGLVLEVSHERGYAFTRQASDPSPHSRTLLRARTLSLAASALALWLYNQYLIAPGDPVVEESDMTDHLLGYKPASDTDEASFVKRARAAIRSLEDAHLIRAVPGTSRYFIYPVITSVLTAERVAALTARYRELAAEPGGPDADELREEADSTQEEEEGDD